MDANVTIAATRAATVRAGPPRVHFVADADMATGCLAQAAGCGRKAYVVPGNEVLVAGDAVFGHVCATFSNQRGDVTFCLAHGLEYEELNPLASYKVILAEAERLGHFAD